MRKIKRRRKAIVGYSLATGERMEWDSITECAEHIGAKPQAVSAALKDDRAVKGWCVAELGKESKAVSMYERGGTRGRAVRDAKDYKLVPMKLDSHTTIYVREYEANDRFVKRYKERLGKVNFDE